MALTISQFLENAGAVNHARDFRRIHDKMLMGWDVRAAGGLATTGLLNGGIARSADLAVSQRGAGANMSVDVAVGFAMVGGTESATQGEYGAFNDAVTNVVISASDPTNPRIDVIGIRNRDAEYSGANNDAALIVVTGTPAGAPAVPTLPANFLTLAHVAVAAAAASIVNGNITDQRRRITALGGTLPVAAFANLPSNPWAGQKAFDYTNLLEYVYNGTFWVCITPMSASTATSEATTSTFPVNLATVAPTVTIQTGTKVLWWVSARAQAAGGDYAAMSVGITGATTRVAVFNEGMFTNSATVLTRQTGHAYITGLTGGAQILLAKYGNNGSGGTATYVERHLTTVGVP